MRAVRSASHSPSCSSARNSVDPLIDDFCSCFGSGIEGFPLVVLVDDADFVSGSLNNFLWVTFTRSNPASDIYGIQQSISSKHWGCGGSLVIDARIKLHHAPPLEEDPAVVRRVEALAAPGAPLHGLY